MRLLETRVTSTPDEIAELITASRAAFDDDDPVERIAGLELVLLGGPQLALADPDILQQIANLLTDSNNDVCQKAYEVLDDMESALGDAMPPSVQSVHSNLGEIGVDYSLLDKLGSFNRKRPSPDAMQTLAIMLLEGTSGTCSFRDIDLLPSEIASEIVPILTDAVRACRDEALRQAAVAALIRLGEGSASDGPSESIAVENGGGSLTDFRSDIAGASFPTSADLELRTVAMNGLGAALKARNTKLRQELNDLFS